MDSFKIATGATRNPIDYRDIPVSADINGLPDISQMQEYIYPKINLFPIFNQGSHPACVGHAETMVKMIQDFEETGVITVLSSRFGYDLCKQLDGNPDGEGTHPRIMGSVLVNTGVCSEKLFVNDISLSPKAYNNLTTTPEQLADAKKHTIKAYATCPADPQTLMATIVAKKAVGITLLWSRLDAYKYYYSYELPAPSFISNPTDYGYHRVFLYGWKRLPSGDILFYGQNSHGEGSHAEGKGRFTFKWSNHKNTIYDIMPHIDAPTEVIEEAKKQDNVFCYTWTKNLSRTTNGEPYKADIYALQQALRITNHFYSKVAGDLEPTAIFGPLTHLAVQRYQRANGINPTGFLGPITRNSLNKKFSKKTILTTSARGLELIKRFEGVHDGNKVTPILEPEDDGVGNYTLGYGSIFDFNGQRVTRYTPAITYAQADQLLARDVKKCENLINNSCYSLNQNQFDALVSFVYNLGSLKGLEYKINAGYLNRTDFTQYVNAYDKNLGHYVTLKGLVTRRNSEADLYFSFNANNVSGMGYNQPTFLQEKWLVVKYFVQRLFNLS